MTAQRLDKANLPIWKVLFRFLEALACTALGLQYSLLVALSDAGSSGLSLSAGTSNVHVLLWCHDVTQNPA